MNFRIEQVENKYVNKISPNVIYNRFDLFSKSNCHLYKYSDELGDLYFEVNFGTHSATLGMWLMHLSDIQINRIVKFIFKTNKNIRCIYYDNMYVPSGTEKDGNHFRIDLPQTIEELDARLSSKGRYNIKREKRILESDFSTFKIERIEALSAEAKTLWPLYFRLKEQTHDHNYNMTPEEYCDVFHVTHIYSLSIGVGDEHRIISLILSCEQCPVVYIENLSYDTEYAKYSPGQILYDEYLKWLIKNGVKEIFLLGGDYDYKRRYGSIEETVYSGVIHRYAKINKILYTFKIIMNKNFRH